MAANIVTAFTDYSISPAWLRNYIESKIVGLDLPGLTNDQVSAINVSLQHPLVRLTATVLSAGGAGPVDMGGILPGITVVEEDEFEERQELGYNMRVPERFTLERTAELRACPLPDRLIDGTLTDRQIDIIDATIEAAGGEVLGLLNAHWMRSAFNISLWTTRVKDQQIIGAAMRGVLLSLKSTIYARGARDAEIRTSSGLVNMNFGQTLFGQETRFSFLNQVRTFEITDKPSFGFVIDGANCTLDIIDPVTGQPIVYECALNLHEKLRAVGRPGEWVDPNPGTELNET